MPSFSPSSAPEISIDHAQRINFASAQNSVPVIRDLQVSNHTGELLNDLILSLESFPAFFRGKEWSIDQLSSEETLTISDRSVSLDYAYLNGLNEAEKGELRLTLRKGDQVLVDKVSSIQLLSRDTWGGLADMAQILAAFVSPNHPAVAKITLAAAGVLEKHGYPRALDGYQSNDPKRAYMLAASVWSSITGLGLTYAVPPASFERTGQKIRDPGRITSEQQATCLDTTLLFCAALEAVGLNPIVVFTKGHAFAGVWLVPKTLPQITEPDVTELRRAIAVHELIVFETTLATSRPVASFEQAVAAAQEKISEANEAEYEQAVDIRRARDASITPLANHVVATADPAKDEPVTAAPLPPPPDFGRLPGELADEIIPDEPAGRIQRWQRKLLDLSLRNRLLNFVPSKQTLPILCLNVPGLEDLLASGEQLRVISLLDENPTGNRDEDLFRQEHGRDIANTYATEAMARKQICVPLAGKDMLNRLTNLFRKAKSDLAEGGTNTLFLAAGFLRWKKDATDKRIYRAPLLLLPVNLTRRSARSDYHLTGHEDEPRFNATLLQFLQRDFDLSIPNLDGSLPEDDSGIDLPLIFNRVRAAIRDVPGFEVVEECALSTFSFAKYLMWKDLVDRTDQLRENRLVRHLIDNPEETFPGATEGMPLPEDIDRKHKPADLLTPLPADSSQLSAVVAAASGKDFVIIGPPGTGKSQTIANTIAHCLAQGKSVLFVAEKSAALDVVHRRLKAYGLGDVCLELHSNKADRKRVLSQLGDAWDRAATANERKWVTITQDLKLHRDQLNAYVDALHKPGKHGVSIFAAIGMVVGQTPAFALSFPNAECHDPETLQSLLDAAANAGRTHAHIQGCECFSAIGCDDWSFAWQNELLQRADSLLGTVPLLKEAWSKLIPQFCLDDDLATTTENLDLLSHLATALVAVAKDDFRAAQDPNFDQFAPGLEHLRTDLAALIETRPMLSLPFSDEQIRRIPLNELERDWREAQTKFWPLSFFAKSRVSKLLTTFAPSDAKGRASPAEDLPRLRVIQEKLNLIDESACSTLPGFAHIKTNPEHLAEWITTAQKLRKAISRLRSLVTDQSKFDHAFGPMLAAEADDLPLYRDLENLLRSHESFNSARSTYLAHARGGFDPTASLDRVTENLRDVLTHKSRLVDWTKWVAAREEANNRGLSPLLEALEAGTISDDESENATKVAYFTWWLPLSLDASAELRGFVHWDHHDRISKFRELDEAVQKLVSAQVRNRLSHGLPARDVVPRRSELGTLRHQLGLQRPSMAIRQLIGEMPDSFNKLTPCLLMSPLSVAQYLPAGHAQFDMVIFDEASQITTWDAIGSIARGRQSIIVGDPKQLPPTNFFGRADDSDDADDGIAAHEKDLPSILEEAVTAGLPEHQLNWHYRSRDESLIAFSNLHYYGGRLVTFPSPKTESDALTFHRVKGVYARGAGRTNQAEAEAIVTFARERMKESLPLPEEDRPTFGVITFNVQQQDLILDLFDAARREDPELEWFWSDDREEPTIVKNLENIQGDEREIMLFSVTFGPDAAGVTTMNFGAINNPGGEKRLNVAITRSRSELHIYASLGADDIDLSRTKALGVAHLKTFLDYAERGPIALPAADQGSLGPAENPFEEEVVRSLVAMGWTVRTQVGVSQFRIDIGVVHPEKAGAYLAGVECDGATYHRSATARDRDKIREAVLRNLGWEIIRIWSTDWFMNPKEAAIRVDGELRDLLRSSQTTDQVENADS